MTLTTKQEVCIIYLSFTNSIEAHLHCKLKNVRIDNCVLKYECMFDKEGNRRLREVVDAEYVEMDDDIIDLTKHMEAHKINAQDVKRIIDKIHDRKPKKVPMIKLDDIQVKVETK